MIRSDQGRIRSDGALLKLQYMVFINLYIPTYMHFGVKLTTPKSHQSACILRSPAEATRL